MKFNELPAVSGKKPQPSVPRHPQPIVRQRLTSVMRSTAVKDDEIRNKREGIRHRADLPSQSDGLEDCSNKHVATNQSTTSSVIQPHPEVSHVEKISDNTNLITEEIAARLYQHSSSSPTVSGGFCDWLTVTFGDHGLDTRSFWAAVDDLEGTDQKYPYLSPAKPKRTAYSGNFRIVSPEGRKLALLQFRPRSHVMRFVRLDFNPTAIGALGVQQVRQVLQMLFGEGFRELLGNGRVTRLDATLDVVGLHVSDMLTYTVQPCFSSRWIRSFPKAGGEKWRLGTHYQGAKNSANRACIYDKAVQLFECKGILLDGPQSRVECRYKPAKGSKPASAAEVLTSANPFAKIKMAYYPSPTPADPWFEFFLYGVKKLGANAALLRIPDKNKRTAFRKALAQSSPDWWQPDRYWSDVLAHIQSLDLFPADLFKAGLQLPPGD